MLLISALIVRARRPERRIHIESSESLSLESPAVGGRSRVANITPANYGRVEFSQKTTPEMNSLSCFNRCIALLLALPLFTARAAEDIFQTGTEWLTPANWNLGVLPGPSDNVIVTATGTLNLAAPATVEIRDLAFAGTTATTLTNSNTGNSLLVLNGGRGVAIPLIQTGAAPVVISSITSPLSLQLKASGEIRVGAGGLEIQAAIGESGGSRGLTKTGPGTLNFFSIGNTYTGPTVVAEGILILAGRADGLVLSGDLIVQSGGSVGFGGNSSNHIVKSLSDLSSGSRLRFGGANFFKSSGLCLARCLAL